MTVRNASRLAEAPAGFIPLKPTIAREPRPADDGPADKFMAAAHHAIDIAFKGNVRLHFSKTGPDTVRVADDMQGSRDQRSWAVLRALKVLADKYGVRMNISGGAGRRF